MCVCVCMFYRRAANGCVLGERGGVGVRELRDLRAHTSAAPECQLCDVTVVSLSLHPGLMFRANLLQCVAVSCSVLQCVAVCCSALQCVAVCCSVLQCVNFVM